MDQILTLRRANSDADIAELEVKVDRMVTELYGVQTSEEMAIVEESERRGDMR